MQIETRRIRLREYHDRDIEELVRLAGDWNGVARWLSELPYPYDISHAVTWVDAVRQQHAAGKPVSFAFAMRHSDRLIGGGGLDGSYGDPDDEQTKGKVALGYWLGSAYQGQGYGTEIVQALVSYGFDTLAHKEIYAAVNPDNAQSQHLLMKVGFVPVGTVALTKPARSGGHKSALSFRITPPELRR